MSHQTSLSEEFQQTQNFMREGAEAPASRQGTALSSSASTAPAAACHMPDAFTPYSVCARDEPPRIAHNTFRAVGQRERQQMRLNMPPS
jgi:hypothetical protein